MSNWYDTGSMKPIKWIKKYWNFEFNEWKEYLDFEKVNDSVDNNAIIEHVKAEYNASIKAVSAKRQLFRNQEYLYNEVGKNDKLDLHTIYKFVQTTLSMILSDDLLVDFLPRQIWWEESAENLKKIARYDAEQMSLFTINYEVQLNRLLRWVGIKYLKWFNEETKTNEWACLDTRQWVPDVNWYFDKKGFAYEWFETVEVKWSLEKWWFKNIDLLWNKISDQTMVTDTINKQTSLINPVYVDPNTWTNFKIAWKNERVDVYHHFTCFDWRKWHVVLWNERTIPLSIRELEAVYDYEKKDYRNIPYPTVHHYFSPKKWDPYGVSLVDLLSVPHIYKNILAQYGFLKEKDSAIWSDIIFDNNVIQQKGILWQASLEKRFIWVDWSRTKWWIGWIFAEVPTTRMAPSNYNYMSMLDWELSALTWLDAMQFWIKAWWEMTLWQSQQLQANNNIRQLLLIKTNTIAEQDFWRLNIRGYRENFKESSKKLVRITNSYGSSMVEFTRKDFITDIDPDVRVVSKAQSDAEKAQRFNMASPLLLRTLNDPNSSIYSKNEAWRELLVLSWLERDEVIQKYFPYTYEELDAKMHLELIKWDNPLWAVITNMNVDHNTYIAIFQSAPNNSTKITAINNRIQAIIAMNQQNKTWQMWGMWWDEENNSNNLNSMTNAAILNSAMQKNQNVSNVISRWNL